MPYDFSNTTFPNNGNMGEFIANAVRSFLITAKTSGGLEWLEQTPAGGTGTGASRRFLFSRGGIGTEAPPFWHPHTESKTLWAFTGDGINTAQQTYDQPGNPINEPNGEPSSDVTTGSIAALRGMGMTTVPGPYQGYWLFGGPNAEYMHGVIKVSDRHYRHFHTGMLTPMHPDLPADTFYTTSHRWGGISPDNLRDRIGATDGEHKPYARHILPFANQPENNEGAPGYVQDPRSQGMLIYAPGYGTDGYDWWFMTGEEVDDGGVDGRIRLRDRPTTTTFIRPFDKDYGDVNGAGDEVLFGWGFVTGYDDTLGTVLFECEPTFTTDGHSLIPIYVCLASVFESARRYAPVGQVPDVYRVNMRHIDAEEEIVIGSDTYKCFPMMNKDANATVAGEGYSGYEGLAYRIITANAT